WTANFVRGGHEYLVPFSAGHGAFGIGVPDDDWGPAARNVTPEQLRNEPVDVVVFQRMEEIDLAKRWLGRTPGKEIPSIYLEHNTPGGDPCRVRHPLADQSDIPIV